MIGLTRVGQGCTKGQIWSAGRSLPRSVIEKYVGPAPWFSNVVLAPKDDCGNRVTVDMHQANMAINSTNIPIARVKCIKAQLAGCQHFSKLDFKSSFHQVQLDEESKKITVFHAGNQLMRYRRLTKVRISASGELTKSLLLLFQSISVLKPSAARLALQICTGCYASGAVRRSTVLEK